MTTQLFQSGGVQTTIDLPQIIYLDFDGELTSYNGEILTVDNVTVEDSGLTEERIAQITQALNDRFAGQNVEFVTEKPASGDYSTIYIGKTSSFSSYGSFAGLAETVDSGNKIRNDNAFVMLDSLSSDDRIADVIAHEAGHLLGILDHGGEKLTKYGVIHYYNQTYTGVLNSCLYLFHCTSNSYSTGDPTAIFYYYDKATGVTINSGGRLYVSSGCTATNITLNSGGYLCVSSGCTATNITLNSGGYLAVSSGCTATNITLNSGGYLAVLFGCTATGIRCNGGAIYNGDYWYYYSNQSTYVYAGGSVTIGDHAVFTGNTASFGGAICNGYFRSYDSNQSTYVYVGASAVFTGNTASSGGAIYNNCGSMSIGDSAVFTGNTASSGGAICNGYHWYYDSNQSTYVYAGGSVTIGDHAVFTGNTASFGGAICNGYFRSYDSNQSTYVYVGASMSLGASAVFSGNIADCGSGCAVYNGSGGSMSIGDHAVFAGNVVKGYAAVIYSGGAIVNRGSMTIGSSAVFSGNSFGSLTCGYGGAIYNAGGSMYLCSAVFTSNSADSGGAVYNESGCSMTFSNCVFETSSDTIYTAGGIVATGRNVFAGAITITGTGSLENQGTIVLDVSNRAKGQAAMISDWTKVSGVYTSDIDIRISGNMKGGTYQLIGNIKSYTEGITVYSEKDYLLGSLSVGGVEMVYDNQCYKLLLKNNTLSLSVYELDREPPVITLTADNQTACQSTTLKAESGKDVEIYYSTDKENWSLYEDAITVTANGTYYFLAYDDAGNQGYNSITFNNIDRTAPVITLTTDQTDAGQGIKLTAVTDDGSPIYYSNDQENWILYTGTITVTENQVLYFYSADSAGNRGTDVFALYDTETSPVQVYSKGGTTLMASYIESVVLAEDGNDSAIVCSGGTVSRTNISSGGILTVLNGGTAKKTSVSGGGRLYVTSGGSVTGSLQVTSGAVVSAYQGASIDFTVSEQSDSRTALINDWSLISGGDDAVYTLTVSSSQAEGTYVLAGEADAFAASISVRNTNNQTIGVLTVGDTLERYSKSYSLSISDQNLLLTVSKNEYATDDSVKLYSGNELIEQADSMSGVTVSKDGSMAVYEGGFANSTTVNSSGCFYVYEGGVANNTTVNSRGNLFIYEGGFANSTTVNSGGNLHIYEDGTANSTTVNSRGNLIIYEGGTANSTTVNSGGNLHIYEDGTANSTTVTSCGCLHVASGGTANHVIWTPCEGQVYVEDGAVITYASSYSGVYFGSNNNLLSSAASMTDKTVTGMMYVMKGGTANSTVIQNGGKTDVMKGGTANSTTVNSEGIMYVMKGGTASNVIVSQGKLHVYSGGTANNIIWTPCEGKIYVDSGAVVTFNSTYSGVYLGDNGTLVSSAKSMSDKTVSGTMYVMSGGTASNITVAYGDMYVWGGGTASNTTLKDNGVFEIANGGAADRTAVSDSSWMFIYGGAVANNTILNTGGYTVVSSGGTANSTTVNTGCTLIVSGGGIANSTTLSDGFMWAEGGCIASSTIINEGGYLSVNTDGIVKDIIINTGGELCLNGILTGKSVFAEDAEINAWGATIDFALAEVSAGAEALINNFSIIQGTPEYTITLTTDQKTGVYSLADGVTEFDSDYYVITIKTTEDEILGTVSAGQTLNTDYADYTLNLNEESLTLAVSAHSGVPVELSGNENGLSWKADTPRKVMYSHNGSVGGIQFVTSGTVLDTYGVPAGTYSWKVSLEDSSKWVKGNTFTAAGHTVPTVLKSDKDGTGDLFFADGSTVWESGYAAKHVGCGTWSGTGEQVDLAGKNQITDVFEGSADANILVMTDDENGDALFVDDIYSAFPEEQQSRIVQIDEIRAGQGDDVVDMTSQRFVYSGDGLVIRGGDGSDTIWANSGNNKLFGDAGNDRIAGASGNDVIAGGTGNDSMHGGGGEDIFCFCSAWGTDTVEQLSTGTVTLWFADNSGSWNQDTMTYTQGDSTVKVSGVTQVTLKYGDDGSELYDTLVAAGCFMSESSGKIWEESGKGILAVL